MNRSVQHVAIFGIAALGFVRVAGAQSMPWPPTGGPFAPPPLRPDSPKPTADPRDIRGYYYLRSFGVLLPGVDKNNPPLQPEALALFQKRVADLAAGQVPVTDPQVGCRPMTAVRMFGTGFPQMQFIQTPGQVTFLLMEDHLVRRIFIGAKHPKQIVRTAHGDSIGHWEGDTLVVDTIGFKGNSWIDETGVSGDENLHLTERIRKLDGGQALEDQVTVEDPTTLTHPISFRVDFAWEPTSIWDEVICEEANRDAGDAK